MELTPGRITGFIGPNGAGKSTTFKAILGLIQVDSGYIELFGKEIKDFSVKDREKLGVTLADSGFSGYLTITDVIKIQKAMYQSFDEAYFQKKCEESKLPFKKQLRHFSTGMKARLQVIAALSHKASLLILDEPTAGLDVIARDETLGLLRDYMEDDPERSIVISSHISTDLEGICDDLYMIDNGRIVLHEDTDRLLSDYAMLKLTTEAYEKLDKSYLLRTKREPFGVSCLTNEKRFYRENYPEVSIENGSIDELIFMMVKGEAV